ncbi:MAG: Na/Pi symporter [Deltaproteobacteria bacterium]|nr:Na/Pi symporter [Deltaproteobacteria bacterium]
MNGRLPPGFDRLFGILKLVALLAALDFFFVSIGLLGAFKELGHGYGATLIQDLARNPFIGLMLGVLVTSVIQSSSTTTSIVVGLVAGGAFGSNHADALRLAVPVIMGANIGTSITNLLVSMAHIGNRREFERAFSCAVVHDFFNLIAVAIFLPLQIMTDFLGWFALRMAGWFEAVGGLTFSSPLKLLTKPQIQEVKTGFAEHPMAVDLMVLSVAFLGLFLAFRFLSRPIAEGQKRRSWLVFVLAVAFAGVVTMGKAYSQAVFSPEMATFLFGLTVLFMSLFVIVKVMKSVVLTRLESLFHSVLFKTALRAMVVGVLMTAMVQSSSVTTSLVVPLAGAGLLTIQQVFPYTLGANVGTTITAMLAALAAGEVTGIAVAFAHLLFNILGIGVIYPFRKVPIGMATGLARAATVSKAYPVLFVLSMYLLVPLVLILVFR